MILSIIPFRVGATEGNAGIVRAASKMHGVLWEKSQLGTCLKIPVSGSGEDSY